MSTAAAPKETLPFSPEQQQVVSGVAQYAKLVAGALLGLGALQLIGGPVAVIVFGAGIFSGVLTMLQGALTVLLGLVMLACASDFTYLAEVPKYRGNHLRNLVKNLKAFYQFQLGLAVLIGLVVLLRLAM
jgi:hypothetical protein